VILEALANVMGDAGSAGIVAATAWRQRQESVTAGISTATWVRSMSRITEEEGIYNIASNAVSHLSAFRLVNG